MFCDFAAPEVRPINYINYNLELRGISEPALLLLRISVKQNVQAKVGLKIFGSGGIQRITRAPPFLQFLKWKLSQPLS